MKCYFCGGINPPNTTFCKRCGALLSEEPDDTQKRIPEKRDPLEVRYEEIENRIKESALEETQYRTKISRREFQDLYMGQIYIILAQFALVFFPSHLSGRFLAKYIFSIESEPLYTFFVASLVICAFAFYIYKIIERGSTISHWRTEKNSSDTIPGKSAFERVAEERIAFVSKPGRFMLLGLLFVAIFGRRHGGHSWRRLLFDVYHLNTTRFFAFIIPMHIILFIVFGKVYDKYSESGKFPKWIEIIDMF